MTTSSSKSSSSELPLVSTEAQAASPLPPQPPPQQQHQSMMTTKKETSTGTSATAPMSMRSDVNAVAAASTATTGAASNTAAVGDEEQGLAGGGEQGEGNDVTTPFVDEEDTAVGEHGTLLLLHRPHRHRRRTFSLPFVRSSTTSATHRANAHHHHHNRGSSSNRSSDRTHHESIPPLKATDLTLAEKLKLVSGKSLWFMNDLEPRIPAHILPRLRLSDGPHGVRKPLSEMNLQQSHPSTCFPTAAALACSWDGPLLQQVGVALRLECLHHGVSVLLGPGMNLKRHAAGGRNFEYFSEDPLLTARCAAFYIHGLQASGQNQRSSTQQQLSVAACAKHYAVNNQEAHRFVVNAKIDERTCRELYLRHFEYICKQPQGGGTEGGGGATSCLPLSASVVSVSSTTTASLKTFSSPSVVSHHNLSGNASIPATLMCSYNKVNGVHCSEHGVLLDNILRNEWGYQGVVMTDWGATNNRALGLQASLDLEMPGSHGVHNRRIRRALTTMDSSSATTNNESNSNNDSNDDDDPDNQIVALSELEHLDPCVDRLLNLIHQLRHSSPAAVTTPIGAHLTTPAPTISWAAHHELAKQVAMDCAVLLKNDNNLLPLPHNTSVAVIGDFAKDHPRYQGMGSSQVFSECVVSALTEFHSYTNKVYFAKGYHADDEHVSQQQLQEQQDGDHAGEENTSIDTDLLDQAVQVAQKAQVVVLCIGLPALYESEGFDRPHLRLPAQHDALVKEICRVHKKVVVVLSNGGAVEMPWADQPQAIFESYLLGETGGAAVVDLIFGRQSPCGKLAETFPLKQSDILADAYFPGTSENDGDSNDYGDYSVEHREGLQVGYRYFDSANYKPVRFPFGHGLTYTTFLYSNLEVGIRQDEEAVKIVDVSFSLTNTGKMTAKEIVQVYVHQADGATVFRPEQELREFDKILVKPNETKRVHFTLTTNAFNFYDIGHQDWIVEPHGAFEIRISASSRDVRLRQTIQFTTGRAASALAQSSYPPQSQQRLQDTHSSMVVDDTTFAKRFGNQRAGFEYVTKNNGYSKRFHRNSLLKQVAHHRCFGRFLLWVVYRSSLHQTSADSGKMTRRQKVLVKAAVENLPLRALVLFSSGGISFEMMDFMIALFNYQFFKALKCLCIALTPFRRK